MVQKPCYTFNSPAPNQSGNQFRREADVALYRIEYNFVGSAPQTVIQFDYTAQNWDTLRDYRWMATGHYRPDRLTISHAGQTIAGYTFTYGQLNHYTNYDNRSTTFWWLTHITPYGRDYVHGTPPAGTKLPAQTFSYEQNTKVCGPDVGGINRCVPILTKVENGYGGVSRFVYARYDGSGNINAGGDWFVVKELYTWDGVRYPYNANNNTAASRIIYSRTGTGYNYAACYDKDGSGCRSLSYEPSNVLVGFNGATLSTQTYVSGAWTTLSNSQEEFDTSTYWKNGKPTWQRTFVPGTTNELTEEKFTWTLVGVDAQLTQQDHYIYADGNTLHTYETFSYLNGSGDFGALYERKEYREEVGGGNTLYRCTQHAYAHQTGSVWLVNRPLRQTLYDGNCGGTKLAETLYRYDAPTSPTDTDLDGKAALEYTLVWRGNTTGDTSYATTRQTYYGSGANVGLPYETITYSNYSSTATFASTPLNTTRVTGYNALGLPTGSQTIDNGPSPTLPTLSQSVSYDSVFAWLPATTTDANNAVTGYKYDKFGRLIKIIRPGDSEAAPTLSYTYFDDPTYTGGAIFIQPLLIETAYNNTLQQNQRQFYNGLGQLVQEQGKRADVRYGSNSFGERDVITTYAYDARGLLTCQTMPYDVTPYTANGQSPYRADNCLNYAHASTTYDMLGRVVKTIAPDNTTTSHHHYGVWLFGSELVAYDDVIDANRHRTQYNYDAWGRLVKVHEISGDCGNYWSSEGYGCAAPYTTDWAVYATTTYGYNKRDQLEDVWDNAQNNTHMTYNALGHKLSMSDPDMGYWTYTYDDAGNLSSQLDARANRLCFYYDNFNRLTYKRHDADNDGCETSDTQLAAYSYGTSAASYNLGRLTQVVDASGTHTFSYDGRGRLSSETRTLTGAPAAYTMSYGYDALDRIISQTYPNSETVSTTYNNQGLPQSLGGTNTYVDAAQYNRMGQMKILDLGNGLKTYYGYNGYEAFGQHDQYDTKNVTWNWVPRYGQLWRICTAADASTLCLATNKDVAPTSNQKLDIRHSFDAAGNVNAIRDYLNDNQVQWFSYDHRNRLETAYTSDATGNSVGAYNHNGEANDYDYNEIGNILRLGNGNTYNYTSWHAGCTDPLPSQTLPHAVRQIASAGNYFCYDKNGNMTKRVEGGITYTQNFDVENRLTSVVKSGGGGTTSFVYDANGQRMKTVAPSGKTIYYPFPGFEVEVNGPVTMRRLTYSLGGQTIAQRELGLGLAENYDDGNASGWTAHSGSWSMQNTGAGYAYRQTNTANNATNSSYALTQSGAMAYEWQATFNSGIAASGLHFMASTAADANHGNSYLVWQNSTTINIYESIGNTMYNRANAGLVAANGQTYQYRVTYNNGVITVWRNGAQVLSWTDGSPLTSGNFVAWRTNQSNVSFDNLRVTGSPSSYNTLVYLHGDHLGSIGAVTNNSGALLDMTRFLPFGGYRGSDPTFLTERGFTGHKMNNTSSNDLGLIYMNARYYVGAIGRFASADTLVPDQIDPQALNRYAYARNNPLLIVDPSGHCWGFAGFLRNTFYSTTCNNLDMAVSIVQHPDASVGEKVAAGAYIAGEAVAHTVAVGGSVVAGVGCLTGAGTAICAGAGTAVTATSADGDPTNEVTAVANTTSRLTSSASPQLNQFWNRATNFLGNKVYQRNDLIDPQRADSAGRTSLELMKDGRAPIGPDGNQVVLHHMLQTQQGPIAEVTRTFHQTYSRILHINPNTIKSGIDRAAFRLWREAYWMERAKDFAE